MQEADYIIIGGGSAGCVLANRLSENPATNVVLLEAGGDGRGFWVDMPVGIINIMGNTKTDWCYLTEPDPSIGNRQIIWNAGKMLGGGGGINGLVYVRGQKSDYDGWEKLGCTGWSFNDLLPYFTKGESWEGDGDFQSHGRTGNLSVSHQHTRSSLVSAFMESARNTGFRYLDDFCGGDIDGVFHSLATRHNGQRCSPAKAYLEPIRGRKNLKIHTHTLVNRILFEGDLAVGVSASKKGGEEFEIRARGEVILSAGATQSPVILMRSGIGPAQQLKDCGIAVLADRQGVGQNLMEHPNFSLRWLVDKPSFNSQLQTRFQLAREMYRYLVKRSGIFTCSVTQAMAGAKTLPELEDPDIMLFFSSFVFDPSKPPLKPGKAVIYPLLDKPAAGMSTFVNRPYSRGEIRLRSRSPKDPPLINPGLLSDERDVDTLVRAGQLIEKVFASPGLAEHVVGRLNPKLETQDEWRSYVRSVAGIGWHASGTCRMGGDLDSVVDPQLRVRGVRGLRVADASIMPTLVSGNTNAPTMMIGERASAIILEQTA